MDIEYIDIDSETYLDTCPLSTRLGAVPVSVAVPPIFAA